MGRIAIITYEQVAAVAEALKERRINPTVRAVCAELGNVGSLGTIRELLGIASENGKILCKINEALDTKQILASNA